MESGKVLQNPRPSHLSNNINTKAMPNELVQKPSPATSVLDRFRALLKQREEEARVSSGRDDGVAAPSTEEVVQLYEMVLAELTFNSKPIITDLTIIAGDQRVHGEGIADAICARIIEVPVEQKLPSLYLLDSIVKNIGREYVRYFSSRLPEVFCEAYRQNPNMYTSMRHLFGTWSTVFPPSVLRKIETQLQFSQQINRQPSSLSSLQPSESPRPPHSIHVNPKYIRQLDNSITDNNIQHVRGTSSNVKMYGQKSAIGYDEFDSDHAEVASPQAGSERISSGSVGRATHAFGANKLHPSSRVGRPMSPSRIGADRILSSEVDEYAVENSPRRLERASPSNSMFDYGLSRGIGRDDKMGGWRRKQHSDNNHNRFETSTTYNLSNVDPHQRPRALIDAYGNDRGRSMSNDRLLQVDHQGVNGMANKAGPKSWQNTEEEEFDWEDMSPTLADRGRAKDLLPPSVPTLGINGARHDLRNLNATTLESDIRGNLSSQAQRAAEHDSPIIAEDAVSFRGSGRGLIGTLPGVQGEPHQNLRSHHPEEAWNMPPHLSRSSHPVAGKGRGRDFQVPFSANAVSSVGGEKMAPLLDKPQDGDAQFVRSTSVVSRIDSPGLDSMSTGAWSAPLPSAGAWPPVVHKSHPPLMNPIYSLQKQINATGNINQGPNRPLYVPEQQLNSFEAQNLNAIKLPQIHDQSSNLNQPHPQFLPSQGARNDFFPTTASIPPHMLGPPLNHGYYAHGQNANFRMVSPNPFPGVQLPIPFNNISKNPLHLQGGALPPLPPGPPPASSHLIPNSQGGGIVPNQPPGAFSDLINSLMAQGLISLSKQTSEQDSVGLDFNADLLKVRHESAITALYSNLPRQCTTCGLRFKCQEEHSSHMDWHVTKNRMSKNRKQKPSRKWFVNASMWLSGAEALGTDAVPGFLPTETVVEKKDDEELAVPADEDQSECALCGEPFEDFFSDETEEWMYKGAVYMNAPDGSTAGMDRSQLGPIVHAKCRSDSTVAPPEDLRHDEVVNNDEGSQRKRQRS